MQFEVKCHNILLVFLSTRHPLVFFVLKCVVNNLQQHINKKYHKNQQNVYMPCTRCFVMVDCKVQGQAVC